LARRTRQGKRQRTDDGDEEFRASDDDEANSAIEIDSDEDQPPAKRLRNRASPDLEEDFEEDAKKKLAMDVSYDGFAIYGQVLCLVVKKRETKQSGTGAGRGSVAANANKPGGQANMENWITSTQMPAGDEGLWRGAQ
jgi:hypothetical protein